MRWLYRAEFRRVEDAEGRLIAHPVASEHARLIAAAPDLLAALKRLLSLDQGGCADLEFERDATEEQARAAIAKAEGAGT